MRQVHLVMVHLMVHIHHLRQVQVHLVMVQVHLVMVQVHLVMVQVHLVMVQVHLVMVQVHLVTEGKNPRNLIIIKKENLKKLEENKFIYLVNYYILQNI